MCMVNVEMYNISYGQTAILNKMCQCPFQTFNSISVKEKAKNNLNSWRDDRERIKNLASGDYLV
jgi:hypothetical protein